MRPTVVLSIDFELAWGSFDHAYGPELMQCARWTHDQGVPAILGHLQRNRLSATWAVVGFLALERLPSTEHLAEVSYPHFPHPWFHHVPPGLSEAEAPEWFGASLVQRIKQAVPPQEIAFHSLSHVVLGAPGTSRLRAQQEFQGCRAVAAQLGCDGFSFVFPRNSIGYLSDLRAAGFGCYRGRDELPLTVPGRSGRSVAALAADVLALTPRSVHPRITNGLVEIPGSLMIRHAHGWRGLVPDGLRLRRLRKGLKRVCHTGGIFHVWLHPHNLYARRPRIERVLATFLDELGAMVSQGRARCLTMGDVAREVLQEGATPMRVAS